MLKKLGVVAIGVTAGLAAAAPLASAQEAGDARTSSSSPATVAVPVEESTLAGVLDQSNADLGSNGDSLSGNSSFVNGHDLSF